jgi:hypothetical protein
MPNAPKTPARQFRIGDQWYAFEAATKAQDTDRATVLREFIDWYLQEPGAQLPERPQQEAWKEPPAVEE